METIIKIDIQNEYDLLEKYDKSKISTNLIDYIIKKAYYTKKHDTIKILIQSDCNTSIKIKELLIVGLKNAYEKTNYEQKRKNIIQILLLLLGSLFIFLSSRINDTFIWKELLLITGWVPIWEMIDIELFNDSKSNRTKKIIKKLMISKIEIVN